MTSFTGGYGGGAAGIPAGQGFAFSGFPSYAQNIGLSNKYDPMRNVYNWKASNTRRLRASISAAIAGESFAHHVFLGDSQTENYMGPADGSHSTKMWPIAYRDVLAALTGVTVAGDGYIKFGSGYSSVDERVTLTGTSYNDSYASTSTNNDKITVATSKPCTNVDFYYFDTTGSWSVSVDGGAAVTTGTTNSGTIKKLVISSTLSNATHSIVATNTAATGTTSFCAGVNCYSGTSGLLVHNLGLYGHTATQFADTSQYGPMWSALSIFGGSGTGILTGGHPAAVFCQLGLNDWHANNRTVQQIAADLTTVRNYWPNSDFVLFGQQQPSGDALWHDYTANLYRLSDTLDVPLLDNYDRAGSAVVSTANGALGSDGLHPTLLWQKEQGRNLASLVSV